VCHRSYLFPGTIRSWKQHGFLSTHHLCSCKLYTSIRIWKMWSARIARSVWLAMAGCSGVWVLVGGEIFYTCQDQLWEVKWLRHHIDHPPTSSAEVKGRVQLNLYSPSGPSCPVIGCILPYKRKHSILLCFLKFVDSEKRTAREGQVLGTEIHM
jgi:hypothetical protein